MFSTWTEEMLCKIRNGQNKLVYIGDRNNELLKEIKQMLEKIKEEEEAFLTLVEKRDQTYKSGDLRVDQFGIWLKIG